MILLLKADADESSVREVEQALRSERLGYQICRGENKTVLCVTGDTGKVDEQRFSALKAVESVKRLQEPYHRVSRGFHSRDTVIQAGTSAIGGGHFMLIAGPCSIENEEQLTVCALAARKSGADVLRGGAFKPRSSPYSFQGLHEEGLRLLSEAKKASGLPVITEIMDIHHLPLFEDVDIIQVGARNMQNFELLKELGRTRKPVLLKRGYASTLRELLMSAEYILSGGNGQVILCERGIRTFETATRNTLDLSAVPVLHRLTHLPVVVDPSHACGKSELVPPLALAAVAAGADGLMLEVHPDPCHALCDGRQSLSTEEFDRLAASVRAVRPFAAR